MNHDHCEYSKRFEEDQLYEGEHAAIISVDVYQSVQSLLPRNAHFGGRTKTNSSALLSQLLRCQLCGCRMGHSSTKRKQSRYRHYVCTKAQQNGYETCPAPTASAPEIEWFVVNEIRQLGQDPALVAATVAEIERHAALRDNEQNRDLKLLQADLKDLYRQLQQAALKQTSIETLADLNDRIRKLQQIILEHEQLTTSHPEMDGQEIARLLQEFDPLWEAMTTGERQRMLQLLVHRIDYNGADGEVAITFTETGRDLTQETP